MADNKENKQPKMMKIVAAVPRKGGDADTTRSFWTKIGVAFENRDASWNLRFDFLPTSPETTIQLREFDPKRDTTE
jgi:hypothetical protein